MKYSKRYIVFGVLVAAMLIFKLEPGTSGSGTVENFRGANLQAATWNPLIASSVNDNLLSLVIDNKEYTNENHTFYMDDQLNIMVPVNILRHALSCSAHVTGSGFLWKSMRMRWSFHWAPRRRRSTEPVRRSCRPLSVKTIPTM